MNCSDDENNITDYQDNDKLQYHSLKSYDSNCCKYHDEPSESSDDIVSDSDCEENVTWIQCEECLKWREVVDVLAYPDRFICSLLQDSSCQAPESAKHNSNLHYIYSDFSPGSLVIAKLTGYPYWPAMIESDPDSLRCSYYRSLHVNSPIDYHVTFFGDPVSRAWISQLFVKRYIPSINKPKQGKLKQAYEALELAMKFDPVIRLEKYGFLSRYSSTNNIQHDSEMEIIAESSPLNSSEPIDCEFQVKEISEDSLSSPLIASSTPEININMTNSLLKLNKKSKQKKANSESHKKSNMSRKSHCNEKTNKKKINHISKSHSSKKSQEILLPKKRKVSKPVNSKLIKSDLSKLKTTNTDRNNDDIKANGSVSENNIELNGKAIKVEPCNKPTFKSVLRNKEKKSPHSKEFKVKDKNICEEKVKPLDTEVKNSTYIEDNSVKLKVSSKKKRAVFAKPKVKEQNQVNQGYISDKNSENIEIQLNVEPHFTINVSSPLQKLKHKSKPLFSAPKIKNNAEKSPGTYDKSKVDLNNEIEIGIRNFQDIHKEKAFESDSSNEFDMDLFAQTFSKPSLFTEE